MKTFLLFKTLPFILNQARGKIPRTGKRQTRRGSSLLYSMTWNKKKKKKKKKKNCAPFTGFCCSLKLKRNDY